MPDEAKHQTLVDGEYVLRQTCETCTYFTQRGSVHRNARSQGRSIVWGHCMNHNHDHGKHSGGLRPTGVLRYGWCPSYNQMSSPSDRATYNRYWERVDRGND